MLGVLLAAASALVWGTADFGGGKASQRAPALTVTVISQLIGLPVLIAALILLPGSAHPADLAWGSAAGLAGLAGLVLLYRGLAGGAMAIVAPVTAVTAAVVPMIVGLVVDRTPQPPALVGAVLAVVSIALISLGPGSEAATPDRPTADAFGTTRSTALALAAGAMFGTFFSLLAQTSPGSGMWPLVAVRFTSIGVGLLLMARARLAPRLTGGPLRWAVLAGAGDISANALFLLATRHGLLSVVAPIASLYPVSTVLLALAVDRERVRPLQLAGLGLAAGALVLAAI
jgi:drug/metabolite transporter (DMT)-like permease